MSGVPLGRSLTRSLKRKILLTNLVVLVLMIGASHLLTYLRWRQQLLGFAQQQGRALSGLMAQRLKTEFMEGDLDGIHQLLQLMLDHKAVQSARVTNESGLVLLSAKLSEEKTVRLDVPRPVRDGLEWTTTPTRLSRGTEALTFYVPIPRGPECRGCHYATAPELAVLRLDLEADPLIQVLRGSTYQVLLITSVTVALLFFALLWLFRSEVNQPVSRILSTMTRARTGDLTVRVPVGNSDELGRIGDELNRMLDQLSSAREQVRQLHQQELDRQGRLATIGNLASAVAHEIKNPLAGIRSGIEVLEDGLPERDPQRTLTREIRLEVDRINRMVRDLLAYSRQPVPEAVPARIDAVMEDVLAQARQLPGAAQIEFNLPAVGRCSRVAVDYPLIKQAFLNIIQNAVDAMPHGGSITVTCEETGGSARISFRDTGGGIAPEVAAKIMQPFFTTRHRGTGLGLPIAQSIVEAHGGELHFRSEPGRGSIFTVVLPVVSGKGEDLA